MEDNTELALNDHFADVKARLTPPLSVIGARLTLMVKAT